MAIATWIPATGRGGFRRPQNVDTRCRAGGPPRSRTSRPRTAMKSGRCHGRHTTGGTSAWSNNALRKWSTSATNTGGKIISMPSPTMIRKVQNTMATGGPVRSHPVFQALDFAIETMGEDEAGQFGDGNLKACYAPPVDPARRTAAARRPAPSPRCPPSPPP
jgi:hypothetical protein